MKDRLLEVEVNTHYLSLNTAMRFAFLLISLYVNINFKNVLL